MENILLANSSALNIADNCTVDCDISAENLAIANCVLRILDTGIEKLQIAMLIPSFLEDQDLLKQYLSKPELQKCIKYYNQYMHHAEMVQDCPKKPLHIALIELIDLFCENRSISEILPGHLSKIPNEHHQLINALKQLREIAEVRLNTTALVEMRREKVIHGIYQDNEKTVQNLAKQKKKLHDQEINLRWKLAAKQAVIKKFEDELSTTKWENNLKIKQEILKSSHKIREFQAQSLARQEHLAEDVEKAKAAYEKNLKANLKAEKEIRDEKNKLLLQLQGLIKKYDQNIGDKILENAEVQKVYDEQKRQFDEFYAEYSRVEEEYNVLAQAKLDEENAEFERKLFFFMGTRAAKVIQRWWRQYLKTQKKLAKPPKAPKEKKGKKK